MNTNSQAATVKTLPTSPHEAMKSGEITAVANSDGSFVIDQSLPAKQAMSCLVTPEIGDTVLYWNNANQRWILAVLTSVSKVSDEASEKTNNDFQKPRSVSLPNQEAMQINGKKLLLNAQQTMQLNSMGNIQLNAVVGKLMLNAKHCVYSIQESLMQMARTLLQRSDYIDQQASKVLKSHAQQQLITAEKDVKIDAQRINMG